jgi:hypothetical protein
MNNLVEVLIQTRQICRKTRRVMRESAIQRNLVLDRGLNALAKSTDSTTPAGATAVCKVGSGSTSDKTSSGAVTFTQVGFTLTANAAFFTAGMVGQLFKWGSGTGGNEIYITAFTSSTIVTVGTSATVAVPAVGVVWNVSRTTLETFSYNNTSYETTAGSCSTTFSAGVCTHKRTYNFATQVASYNVNEVGWFTSAGSACFGRLVLAATEVVAPTNFLQVVLSLVVTYSPSAITAVADVGTTINTAGNAMTEKINAALCLSSVASTGATNASSAGNSLDGAASCQIVGIAATYTQNATVNAAILTPTTILFETATWAYNSVRGQMKLGQTNTTISTTGQTLYGVGIRLNNDNSLVFDVKFTATYVTPNGSFLPKVTILQTYNRVLNN